jgi:DNA-binding response OmpR family regulator
MKIMVVDDDKAFLRSLEILLTGAGHEVMAFSSPVKAVSAVESMDHVDILILDYCLGEIDGCVLLETIKSLSLSIGAVIMISAHTDILEKFDLADLGFDYFISKPIVFDELKSLIDVL